MVSCAKNGWTDRDAVWVVGSRNHVFRSGSRSLHAKRQLGEKDMPGHARRQSAVNCAKMVNRSRCRFGCGLRWAQGSMCYIGCTLRQPGKCDSTARERRQWGLFVKLLWPLVTIITSHVRGTSWRPRELHARKLAAKCVAGSHHCWRYVRSNAWHTNKSTYRDGLNMPNGIW